MVPLSSSSVGHAECVRHVQVSEQLKARVAVQHISGSRVTFRTECFGHAGKLLIDGTALALMPSSG